MEKLKAKDMLFLLEQDAVAYLRPHLKAEHLAALETAPHSWTVFSDEKPILCAGVQEYWPGRGETWAFVDKDCKRDFVAVHNIVKRFLDICPVKRIEASVAIGFEAGHRWVKALGFRLEAERLRAYLPDGSDCSLYARVR